ncbi:MAG: hypothetical protein NPIRA05_22030 [Nitrospirales bacterium]|nr:MAG: hypothetical protein NPIRA05_22030 [Nitrospirales bacterium]
MKIETPVAAAAVKETGFDNKVLPDGQTTLSEVEGILSPSNQRQLPESDDFVPDIHKRHTLLACAPDTGLAVMRKESK